MLKRIATILLCSSFLKISSRPWKHYCPILVCFSSTPWMTLPTLSNWLICSTILSFSSQKWRVRTKSSSASIKISQRRTTLISSMRILYLKSTLGNKTRNSCLNWFILHKHHTGYLPTRRKRRRRNDIDTIMPIKVEIIIFCPSSSWSPLTLPSSFHWRLTRWCWLRTHRCPSHLICLMHWRSYPCWVLSHLPSLLSFALRS